MDNRIDLDAAAALIEARLPGWRARTLEAGPLTWRDESSPAVLETDRGRVAAPDSVGIEVRRGAQEGQLVLFKGGWADLEYWSGRPSDDLILRAPGWEDWLNEERFGLLLDQFAALFGIE